MSVNRYVVIEIQCDDCEQVSDADTGVTARQQRALIAGQGWTVQAKRDLCPECTEARTL